MNGNKIIPFTFITEGYCPYCMKTSLRLLSRDIISTKINPDGSLGDTSIIDFESAVVCIECKRVFDYTKKGLQIQLDKKPILVLDETNPLGKLGDDTI